MGSQQKRPSREDIAAMSAMDLFGCGPSEGYRAGRRLLMKFRSREMPELDRIEFWAYGYPKAKHEYLQRENLTDSTRDIRAAAVTTALPLFLLDHLCARLQTPPRPYLLEGGDGSQAATVGYALSDSDGTWRQLFTEYLSNGGKSNRVNAAFAGSNFHGKGEGARIISVRSDYLPADCFQIVWRDTPLSGREEIQQLTDLFRKVWNLPPPTPLTLPSLPDGPPKAKPESLPARPPKKTTEEVEESPDYFASRSDEKKLLFGKVPPKSPGESPTPEKPLDLKFTPDQEPMSDEFASQVEPDYPKRETQVPGKIASTLFEIQNPNGDTWDDSEALLNFGFRESEADLWRVRDACEGVAVFGAVGSGKTSGSGYALAQAFLQAGFGGLVLTVKPDEAQRWQRLCRETGRDGDFVHVTPTSGHRLNFLQYELERPGERLAVTDDLIALFRTLIGVMSRSKRNETADDFWTNTTNQLIRKLVDIFLLAGEPLTLDRMVHFINQAPKNLKQDWQYSDMFAEVINRAEAYAEHGSQQDKRVFRECLEYWTDAYPGVADVTRSGFITGFAAMADVLSGRGIHEMTGTDTNLTPEMILSGKVVVLDIPLKGNVQGGMMVQAMWKLLFQQAAERRADKGQPAARPAFLWEDEGHMFFSQHDVNFQPTARDCRVPHDIISQNLHNFFQQGHNEHAVEAVFAAMNTLVFHTNGDMTTNEWASKRVGTDRREILKSQGYLRPVLDGNISFFKHQRPEDFKNVGGFKWEKEKEPAFPPEDFAKLKRGGDGTCEAVIFWLAHQFEINEERNFAKVTFGQEKR
jgi:hypothetical protein